VPLFGSATLSAPDVMTGFYYTVFTSRTAALIAQLVGGKRAGEPALSGAVYPIRPNGFYTWQVLCGVREG
jgi:hypothetical protein